MIQQPCAAAEQIQAYLLGRLSQEQADTLALHLASCSICSAVADRLEGVADPLLHWLRRAQLPVSRSTLPTCGPAHPTPDQEAAVEVPAPPPGVAGDESFPATPSPDAPADEQAPEARPPVRLPSQAAVAVPGYEILGELGRGGMGVVYKARQTKADRLVALKMILSSRHASLEHRVRFQIEAEAVARLAHANIVQVYEVGEHDGLPFFSLEFCPGGSLDKKLRGRALAAREAAPLTEQLARAVHYAHSRGVIHRDLKPGNVLLGEDGTPKVSDFGLAKRLDEAGQTASGAVVGTPSYMAPEQAQGKGREVGPAADVYSLGAILYELLTGRPPFRAATAAETLLQVLTVDPVPPSRLQPKVPRDLETICVKCLHKQPDHRYPSAESLAEDLRRWREGEPIFARPVGRTERVLKWARRRPAAAALLVVSGLALVGLVVGTILLTHKEQEAVREKNNAVAALHARAAAQVQALLIASPQAVPDLLRSLPLDDDILAELRRTWQDEGRLPSQRLRAGLALLPVEPEAVRDRLFGWMLEAKDPAEMLVVRDQLARHAEALRAALWQRVEDPNRDVRFRALVALATFDPRDPRWPQVAPLLADRLVTENVLLVSRWSEALKQVHGRLIDPLAVIFRDRKRREAERDIATMLLAEYAADRSEVLAELIQQADPTASARFLAKLQRRPEGAIPALRAALERKPTEGWDEDARDSLAAQHAKAAVMLLHLGQAEDVWPLLRHRPDPRLRSDLLSRLAPLGVNPRLLIRRLEADAERDVSARRALILALGEFDEQQLPADVRGPMVRRLLRWYREDPDPGIHGAIDWLLRHGKEGPVPRPLDWEQADKLAKIDAELTGRARLRLLAGPLAGLAGLHVSLPPVATLRQPRWYVTAEGYTMTVIPGPVEFLMGSPASEPRRVNRERQHRRLIGRSFAIASKPVTVAQFERFLAANPEIKRTFDDGGRATEHVKKYSPAAEGPIILVHWFTAAAYCNWLSKEEGIPREQWCYPADPGKIRPGMAMPERYLSRTGYRLPTAAEWEYACRAGAVTSRYYGASEGLLPRYAWYTHNSRERTWPVGQKRPNDLGLFDMLGNAWTWCQDASGDYPPARGDEPIADVEDTKDVPEGVNRVFRGGSFAHPPLFIRCAYRDGNRPLDRPFGGLRVARTYR